MIWPFVKTISTDFGKHPFANLFWLLFGGLMEALGYFIVGLIFCITIIGIPFGKQCFKLSRLALAPFGSVVS